MSLLIGDEFMRAVEADGDWPLLFPVHPKERAALDLEDPAQVLWRDWPLHAADYCVREDGLVACKVYATLRAREQWLAPLCIENGFRLSDRLHIHLYGDTRGT